MKAFGKELKLLILDIEGVLLDLMVNFEKNLPNAAKKFGLSPIPAIEYINDLKSGTKRECTNFDNCLKMLYPNLDEFNRTKLKKTFIEIEDENPYPAIIGSRAIVQFFSRKIPVALCTTNRKDIIIPRVVRVGFNMRWFSYISSWETGHPKPDPRALTIITDFLNIPKENSLFVGDWYPDLECAQRAEFPFVAVLSGVNPEHAFLREGVQKDHIIDCLFNITEIIKP